MVAESLNDLLNESITNKENEEQELEYFIPTINEGDDETMEDNMTEIIEEVVNTSIDNEEINEELQVTEDVEPVEDIEEITPPEWTHKLSDYDSFELTEFGKQTYVFKCTTHPDGEKTGYYTIHCKDIRNFNADTNEMYWISKASTLSSRYVVANVEKFVEILTTELGEVHDPKIYHEPFGLVWMGKTNTPVNIFDDDATKIVFSIISGVDSEIVDSVSSHANVCVSNRYDGTKCLYVDTVIRTSMTSGETEKSFKDYFTLANMSKKIEHMNILGELSGDLTNIQGFADESIAILKACTNNISEIVDNISKKFKKPGKDMFLDLWDNLVSDYRNLYYALILASIVLDKNYTMGQYDSIRTYIDKIYADLIASAM